MVLVAGSSKGVARFRESLSGLTGLPAYLIGDRLDIRLPDDVFEMLSEKYLRAFLTILYETKKETNAKSLNQWARAFGKNWSVQNVRSFFILLNLRGLTNTETTRSATKVMPTKPARYGIRLTQSVTQSPTNLNDKIKYAEFVKMKEEEHNNLINEYGEEFTEACIVRLNNYKGANGKEYKSDYLAILNWVVKREFQTGEWNDSNQEKTN